MQTQTETNGKSHHKDTAGELVLQLPVKDIVVKTQERKTFTGIEELAESIKAHGLIHPVLVRKKEGRLEFVVGERRLRATKLAKLPTIAAIVRVMTDLQALEVQIIENCQRQDVHPIEEAEAYDALHRKHGYKVEDIAAKVGKSTAHIYQRLKLCALSPEARRAFYDDKIVASVAFLVARIPTHEQQNEALKACTRVDQWNQSTPSYATCARLIQEGFMLRLADAPFDRADAKLIPAAGACTSCVKRTGNQPELFGDVKSKDTCTDSVCFKAKVDVHVAGVIAKAKAKGKDVLAPEKAAKVIVHGRVSSSSDFVNLNDQDYSKPKAPKYKDLVGADTPVTLAVDPESGKIVHLVKRADLEKGKREARGSAKAGKSDEAKRREKDKRRKALVAAGVAAIVAKAEARDFTEAQWRALVLGIIQFAWADVVDDVAKRRELTGGKRDRSAPGGSAVEAFAKKAKLDELRGLAVELVCARGNRYELGAAIRGVADAFKVDLKKLAAKKS